MQYHRTDDGQIQADLARRLGIVLRQYHEQITSTDKYEVSLSLSILQTLLTNCVELTDALPSKNNHSDPLILHPIPLENLGFNETNIFHSSFHQPKITALDVIHHLRNSMSHPTKLNLNADLKTTGYSTIESSPAIQTIVFVTSPDITSWGRPKTYKTKELAESILKNNFSYFPTDVEIMHEDKFYFSQNGKPFYRIFEIRFSPINLLNLTYALATYLAHPLKKEWDGKSFNIGKLAA